MLGNLSGMLGSAGAGNLLSGGLEELFEKFKRNLMARQHTADTAWTWAAERTGRFLDSGQARSGKPAALGSAAVPPSSPEAAAVTVLPPV